MRVCGITVLLATFLVVMLAFLDMFVLVTQIHTARLSVLVFVRMFICFTIFLAGHLYEEMHIT
jgi:hypothetical protein